MELQKKEQHRAPLADDAIVQLFWSRDEKAVKETDVKYGAYLLTIAYRFLRDEQDSEECVNDTYLGAWNAIPPAKPHSLKAFLTTIVRRIATNRYHRRTRARAVPTELTLSLSDLEAFISGEGDPVADFDAARLGEIISGFIRSLNERRRYVFMSRYYMAETVDTIAKELRLSRSTINKELAAIRPALREILESEGYVI